MYMRTRHDVDYRAVTRGKVFICHFLFLACDNPMEFETIHKSNSKALISVVVISKFDDQHSETPQWFQNLIPSIHTQTLERLYFISTFKRLSNTLHYQ